MKLMNKPVALILGVSVTLVSLSGCQQGYSVKTNPVPAPVVKEAPIVAPAPAIEEPVVVEPPVQPPVIQPPVVVVTPTQTPAPVVVQPVVQPPVVQPAPKPAPIPVATVPKTERQPLPPVVVPGPGPMAPPVIPVPVAKNPVVTEVFDAASSGIKKIDFLFIVDNSGSMSDNQLKLARGFKAFANTFYRRTDLDICTMIITSDRYMGKTGVYGKKGNYQYERERRLPCTKPVGSQVWSAAQTQTHIDSLIESFQEEIYVGTYGSGVELLGKSLVSFLFNQDTYREVTNTESRTSFFRKDAVANISFLSDENNYFYQDSEAAEEDNDLPNTKGVAIPGHKAAAKDMRIGIKDYLDQYFSLLNPGKSPSYSVTTILDIYQSADTLPGIAVNLKNLPSVVGRESKEANINGSAEEYTEVYQSIADAIVLRASEFKLSRLAAGDITVRLRRLNGDLIRLSGATDYMLEDQQVLKLNPRILPVLKVGDKVEVTYSIDLAGLVASEAKGGN
jgi:hypothetical protein